MAGSDWVPAGRAQGRPARDTTPPSVEEETSRAMRVALADFRGACAQSAAGGGMALGALLVIGWSMQAGMDRDARGLSTTVLLLLSGQVLPLAVAASVVARHFQVAMRPTVGGHVHIAALLVPAAFFAGSLFLIFGDDPFLAILVTQGAPSAALLFFALPFQTDRGAWPRVSVAVGGAGLALTFGLVAVLFTSPATLFGIGPGGSVSDPTGLGPFAPYLYAPLAQVALGVGGRLIPLRLRTDGVA